MRKFIHFLNNNLFFFIVFTYVGKLFLPSLSITYVISGLMVMFILTNLPELTRFFYRYNILLLFYLFALIGGMIVFRFSSHFNNHALLSAVLISFLPIFFAYYFRSDTHKRIRNLVYANFLMCLIGLVLYVTMPAIYVTFLHNSMYDFYLETYLPNPRFNALLSSIMMGNICVVSVPLTIYLLQQKKIGTFLSILLIGTFSLCTILTMQRSAIVSLVIVLLIEFFYYGIKYRTLIKQTLLLGMLGAASWFVIPVGLREILSARLQLINVSAVSDRGNQWVNGLTDFLNNPIGTGLGSNGYSGLYSLNDMNVVTDGNYFKILAELGVLGIVLFLTILLLTFLKSLQVNIHFVLIISVYIFQLLGSNLIDVMYTSLMFWSIVGFIINHSQKRKDESP